jgi:hypothetical protein
MRIHRIASRTTFLVATLAATGAAAQTPIYHLKGNAAGERFGADVAYLPDRDGDGRDELLIGAPLDGTAFVQAGAVRVLAGANGIVVGTLYGDAAGDRLGRSVAPAGDVDADGVVDFIAGAPSECGFPNVGYARVFSGATLATLFTVHGDTFLDRFGHAVSGAGDQDLDGHADFAVGAQSFCGGFDLNGYVRAYSGATGLMRWEAGGDGKWDSFGISLDALGDHDQDGIPDLIVGAPGSDVGGYDAGRFYVLSGVDGSKLYVEEGEAGLHYSGFDVCGIGDADLDGVVDYAIGVPGEQDNFPEEGPHPAEFGKVQIMSGASRALLFETYGPDALDHLGWAVALAGDLDADGYPEVAAAATRFDVQTTKLSLGPPYVEIVSTATGLTVQHLEGPVTAENYEVALAAGGDVNGDGTPDVVLGSSAGALTAGFAEVLSGRELELSSDIYVLAGPKAKQQPLVVGGVDEYAGQFYRVLGSFSGTSPGFELDGVHVPLNPDDYLTYTLDPPKGKTLKHSTGIVGKKKPMPTFRLTAPLGAELAGLTVNHVVVIYGADGHVACVSAPVPVTVIP